MNPYAVTDLKSDLLNFADLLNSNHYIRIFRWRNSRYGSGQP